MKLGIPQVVPQRPLRPKPKGYTTYIETDCWYCHERINIVRDRAYISSPVVFCSRTCYELSNTVPYADQER